MLDGRDARLAPHGRQCIRDFLRRAGIPDVVEQEPRDLFEQGHIRQSPSADDVFEDDGIVDAGQILMHIFLIGKHGRIGKGTPCQILTIQPLRAHAIMCGYILCKRKRLHPDLDITTGKQRRKFPGQEPRIGARHIDIAVLLHVKRIHRFFEVFHLLHFIDKNIIHALRLKPLCKILQELPALRDINSLDTFEVQGNDMILRHAALQQFISEHG